MNYDMVDTSLDYFFFVGFFPNKFYTGRSGVGVGVRVGVRIRGRVGVRVRVRVGVGVRIRVRVTF